MSNAYNPGTKRIEKRENDEDRERIHGVGYLAEGIAMDCGKAPSSTRGSGEDSPGVRGTSMGTPRVPEHIEELDGTGGKVHDDLCWLLNEIGEGE